MKEVVLPITESNKANWIDWCVEQLDDTRDPKIPKSNRNRVFLTEEDDRDIAKHLINTLLETLKVTTLNP